MPSPISTKHAPLPSKASDGARPASSAAVRWATTLAARRARARHAAPPPVPNRELASLGLDPLDALLGVKADLSLLEDPPQRLAQHGAAGGHGEGSGGEDVNAPAPAHARL